MSVVIEFAPPNPFPSSHGKPLPLAEPHRPVPRGPLSGAVLSALRQEPGSLGLMPSVTVDALSDDDLHLALYCCYELHYRGLAGVDPEWEWDPELLGFRATLERALLERLRDEVGPFACESLGDVGSALDELIASASGPSLSTFILESGSLGQLREFCVHRSAYQLKEADPHTFAIPRLSGEAKVAMVEIQYDEYGSGSAVGMHSSLSADTMTAVSSSRAIPGKSWSRYPDDILGTHRVGHSPARNVDSRLPPRAAPHASVHRHAGIRTSASSSAAKCQ